MTLPIIGLLAVITVLATITFLLRIMPWSKILRFHAFVDVGFTIAMFAIFAGTLGGALVAASAALLLSLTLTAGRALQRSLRRARQPRYRPL